MVGFNIKIFPRVKVLHEDGYYLYRVSHSLPNPAGWRTAAPCRNN